MVMKPLPEFFMGRDVIAHMRIPHTPGTVTYRAVIICQNPDQPEEYAVHLIGTYEINQSWFGISGHYPQDIKDVGDAFAKFTELLRTHHALPRT